MHGFNLAMSIFTPKVSTALKSLNIRIAEKGASKELVYRSQQLPTDVNVSQDIQASGYICYSF